MFGLYGVVGGMMVIELLAGTMGRGRGRIAVVEDDVRQTYTVKHIRKGLFCATFVYWGLGWKRGEYWKLVSKWHGKVRSICAKIVQI